jgi:hypothetical protein
MRQDPKRKQPPNLGAKTLERLGQLPYITANIFIHIWPNSNYNS